ncbi:EVI5 [Scenedesmus sp. PABB004]|nr:EVI5 [Scenedesmus sp. PABB004]
MAPGGLKQKLAALRADLVQFAETVGEVAQATGELLFDPALRKQGATFIAQEASKGINEVQRGIGAGAETLHAGARARLGAGAQRIGAVLARIERQIAESQRQQQARDLEAELAHHHKALVDVQVGDQVLEDMPQELRSRLWYVLLERPDLAAALMPQRQGTPAPGDSPGGSPAAGAGSSAPASPFAAFSATPEPPGAAEAPAADAQQPAGGQAEPAAAEPVAAEPAAAEPAAAGLGPSATESTAPDIDDLLAQQSTGVLVEPPSASPSAAAALPALAAGGGADSCGDSRHCEAAAPVAPSPWAAQEAGGAGPCASGGAAPPVAPSPWAAVPGARSEARGGSGSASSSASGSEGGGSGSGSAAGEEAAPAAADWEMVPIDLPLSSAAAEAAAAGNQQALESLRALVDEAGGEPAEGAAVGAAAAARRAVLAAMLEVPWLPGEGIPAEVDEGGEYAALLAAGCGCVEDVILRDVPRTFPEHPLFASAAGQGRLLRVLKAYAAADPEVGYTQGMAFPAGVLLMYLPEEPAFRLFRRLMTSGPTLRRLYLPGLEHLQRQLSAFELLLATHAPPLHQHLLDAAVPALLYAAQWLMTGFAAPFPAAVPARLIDALLQAPRRDDDALLLRLGLAVMSELQPELLELGDFESLIMAIKAKPLAWPRGTHRRVFGAALASPASDSQVAAAAAAAAAEFSRLGRFASFSSTRLGRGEDGQAVLEPGVAGPRTEAAAAAAVAAEQQAGEQQDPQQEPPPAPQQEPPPAPQQQQEPPQQQQGEAGGSSSSSTAAAAAPPPESSGVLAELDAALLGLMLEEEDDVEADEALCRQGGGGVS